MKRAWLRPALSAAVALAAVLVPLSYAGAELGDIVFQRKHSAANEYPPATFPHFVHRIQFKCHVCHEAIFKMRAGANNVSMEAIARGKFCGHCHDGKTAFGVTFEACLRCHRSATAQ